MIYSGNYFLVENENQQAIERYALALNIFKKIGNLDSFSYASLLNNIGIAYIHIKESDKAIEVLEKSKMILERLKLQESWTYASALANLSNVYHTKKDKTKYKKNIQLEWKMQKQIINSQTKYIQ